MSEIKFDEEQYSIPDTNYGVPKVGGITSFFIKIGLAKNAKQANLVMLGVIVILMIISFFSLRSLNNNQEEVPSPPEIEGF